MANKLQANRRVAGFSLLEVLIAMIIFTAAASIILDQVYVVLKYGDRARSAGKAIEAALNQAAAMPTVNWATVNAQIDTQQIRLGYRDDQAVAYDLSVRNFTVDNVVVDPTVAFSPYQVFDYGGSAELRLELLQMGLLPAAGSTTKVLGRQ